MVQSANLSFFLLYLFLFISSSKQPKKTRKLVPIYPYHQKIYCFLFLRHVVDNV